MGDDKQPSVKSTESTPKSTEPTKTTTQSAKSEEDKDIENKSKSWGDRLGGIIRNPGKPGNPAN